MDPAPSSAGNGGAAAYLIHRELLQLVVLVLIAGAAFFLTRAVAQNNRKTNIADAAEWYARGERELAAGAVDEAIASLRHATTRDRGNKRYVLGLARALASNGHDAAARAALLELRDTDPDDADVNLQLARLAARRRDVTEASRYYHNALYAPGHADDAAARRAIRLELIEFLLNQQQNGRALSELLALATNLPASAAWHVQVAQLFAKVGDDQRALSEYEEALRIDPGDDQARADAGQAAFRLGDYDLARRYLHQASSDDPAVASTRKLVDVVLTSDPLAPRIGRTERRRRMIALFDYAQQRFTSCVNRFTSASRAGRLDALEDDMTGYASELTSPEASDADLVETGVDLVYRLEQVVVQRCGPPAPIDRALLLIGRRHGAGER